MQDIYYVYISSNSSNLSNIWYPVPGLGKKTAHISSIRYMVKHLHRYMPNKRFHKWWYTRMN